MKTNRIVLTLFMGLVFMTTNSGAATRDTHQTHAPPKPIMGALDNIATPNTFVIEPSNAIMFVNPYSCTDVTSNTIVKGNNVCVVPMRPSMDENLIPYAPQKRINWPDSKRYVRWILRAQCTAPH